MPKTITDIIPPSRRRAMEEAASSASGHSPVSSYQSVPPPPTEPPHPYEPTHRNEFMDDKKSRFPWGLAVVALVVVVGAVGAMYAFSGAKVTVTPTQNVATVSGEFSATPSSGELPYEVITVEKIGMQEVKAEGTENANDPAQGTIVIYNGQEKVQELIKNTRFETPDGLIFRIHDSVKVPGGTADAPGQLQVTAYADAGGEKYNIGPSTYTLPGLKGSAAYPLVYAKSTGSMEGGFSGMRPSVSEKTRDEQSPAIQAGLMKSLQEEVAAKVPEGYILVPGAMTISYAELPSVGGSGDKVQVQEKGTALAFVFPKEALAKAIAYGSVGSYGGQTVTLADAATLSLTPKDGVFPLSSSEGFLFNLDGNATISWVVDPAKVAGGVAGKTRQASQTILAGFPEIDKAVLSLKPFWAGSMPEDPAEIKVIIEGTEAK